MNVTPLPTTLPTATAFNPQTESLRRENSQREVITQTLPTHQSAAEKGVASEREKAKTPAQVNEQVDFASLKKDAAIENSTITDQRGQQQSSQQQPPNQESSQQEAQSTPTEREGSNSVEDSQSVGQEKEGVSTDDGSAEDRLKQFAEQQTIKDLQARDREVRSHELAHATAGGAYTGAPSFSFEVGPDGKKYAVDGEVSVDLAPIDGNPRATIAKMQKVYNAALAPANPSIQDMRVANSAAQQIARAQTELLAESSEAAQEKNENGAPVADSPNGKFTTEVGQVNDQAAPFNAAGDRDFDQLISDTLASQEAIAPTRSKDVDQRALRIENFYSGINQAFEKPPRNHFDLTA